MFYPGDAMALKASTYLEDQPVPVSLPGLQSGSMLLF